MYNVLPVNGFVQRERQYIICIWNRLADEKKLKCLIWTGMQFLYNDEAVTVSFIWCPSNDPISDRKKEMLFVFCIYASHRDSNMQCTHTHTKQWILNLRFGKLSERNIKIKICCKMSYSYLLLFFSINVRERVTISLQKVNISYQYIVYTELKINIWWR